MYSISFPKYFALQLENCSNSVYLKQLHACLLTRGFQQDVYLCSKLVISLARFNLLRESKYVFSNIVNDDLSFWNSITVGYFRANRYKEILGLYLNLRQRNIGLPNSAIVFGLKSCVELGIYKLGRNLHTDVLKFGMRGDQFVCSSLIGFYSNCDQIADASKVFDEMSSRDLVSYTSMITAYARLGDHSATNAFRVAVDMQRNGFEPNRVTLVSLLQCASQLKALERGRSIHGYAVRRGIGDGDEVFDTSLMDLYIKSGDLEKGRMIFNKSKKKSTASWNALIIGYLQLGQPFEALGLFYQMAHENRNLDSVLLATGLLICVDLGYLFLGKAIHCYVLRKGIHLHLCESTALINMYAKCKDILGAVNVFNITENKDGVLFGVMIGDYLCNGLVFEAVETFGEMVSLGIKPSTSTVINMLSAVSGRKDVNLCKSVHAYVIRQSLEAKTDIANQLISAYAKCGLIGWASLIFNRIRCKDTLSWTSIMAGLVNHGNADEAIRLFTLMQRENILADGVTFTCLLQAMTQLGPVVSAREVHCCVYRRFMERDTKLMNALITAYGRSGQLKMASNVFERMSERCLASWNTMICAYAMNGECTQALTLFSLTKKENLCPDSVTFKAILSACSHFGLIEKGLQTFASMETEHGVTPTDEHYACVVDMLGRAGQLEEAYGFVQRVSPGQNGATLGALLAACRVHGNSEIGERVGKWLLDVEPQNSSAYCSVSNLYAEGGRWEDVARIGGVAKEKGLRRTSGCSLI